MTPKRILFSTLLLFSIFSETVAQEGRDILDHLLIKAAEQVSEGVPRETYEGSPYLQETFVVGHVYFGEVKSLPVAVRYNIHADFMEIQVEGVTYLLKPDPRITKIQIGEQTFVPEGFNPLKKTVYLELVENGKLTLLARKTVNYRKKIEISGVPAKYSRQPDQYYYKFDKQPVAKITSVKDIIENSPERKEELSQFVKAEKISSKDRHDLVKLVTYYNSQAPAQ